MALVKLVFPSLLLLWEYKHVLNRKALHTALLERSLVCQCTEAEVELAQLAYEAKVEVLP